MTYAQQILKLATPTEGITLADLAEALGVHPAFAQDQASVLITLGDLERVFVPADGAWRFFAVDHEYERSLCEDEGPDYCDTATVIAYLGHDPSF